MSTTIGEFFNKDNRASAADNEGIADIIETAKGIARCSSLCVYLIDYATQGFLWFSDNLSIFSGTSNSELQRMGYEIFIRNVPEKEQQMLLQINRAGWEFFQKLPVQLRTECTIFYSFHFVVGKRKILIDHRLTPVKLDKDGNCRIALCVFSPSSLNEAGHVIVRCLECNEFWEYSLEGKRWKQVKMEPLTPIERDVLLMSFQGLKQTEIADNIHYSVETVKHIKTRLFERFEVKNISQAVNYATAYGLLAASKS